MARASTTHINTTFLQAAAQVRPAICPRRTRAAALTPAAAPTSPPAAAAAALAIRLVAGTSATLVMCLCLCLCLCLWWLFFIMTAVRWCEPVYLRVFVHLCACVRVLTNARANASAHLGAARLARGGTATVTPQAPRLAPYVVCSHAFHYHPRVAIFAHQPFSLNAHFNHAVSAMYFPHACRFSITLFLLCNLHMLMLRAHRAYAGWAIWATPAS